jgi:hypothetical protein
LYSRADPIFL